LIAIGTSRSVTGELTREARQSLDTKLKVCRYVGVTTQAETPLRHHVVKLTAIDDVDDEVKAWLTEAYDFAGG
jgi:hypothetical protein